jgi:pilus assembly protein CpaF
MIPKALFEETLLGFLAPVRPYLERDGITEIMINGPTEIYIESKGRLELTDARFESREALMSALRNLAQYVGRPFDEERPILEARLPDGSRVEAVMTPAATDGPCVAIRRFSRKPLTPERLVELGSLTPDALLLLSGLVLAKQNILVAGGTNSGKTSLLNAVSSFVPADERILVIEDARELALQQPHVVNLEAQPGDHKGRGRITIRELFRASLRLRPDRIVVGEVRGGEALDLVQAMTSGHGGCLSTLHASHPIDALGRLETMALMSDVSLPLRALRSQIASAVNFIVQVARDRDGSRAVTEVSEVVGHDESRGYRLADILVRRYEPDDADGSLRPVLRATGAVPRCHIQMRALGVEMPRSILAAAEP